MQTAAGCKPNRPGGAGDRERSPGRVRAEAPLPAARVGRIWFAFGTGASKDALRARPDPVGDRPHFVSRRAPDGRQQHPHHQVRADALKRELKRLKSVERPRIVHEISVARDHGDLSENAEYHAAKEKQSHVEGRIQMLEDRLARAEIIDVKKLAGERVVFGATVKLEDTDSGQSTQYTIVGEDEADLKKGRISITSPIARGLVGREVGDSVRIRTPGGEREYEILEVSFVEYTVEEGD